MLSSFFNPKAVAVVGASSKPGKVGYDVLHNLLRYAYQGAVYPVNPGGGAILGRDVCKSVQELPDGIELGVIAVKAHLVPQAVRDLAGKGIMAQVVVSAGFKEVGGEGPALERELDRAVADTGVRMIGPNCIGIMDTQSGLNATFAADMARKGHIGFFSQSGAMCLAILDWALDNEIGFSKFVSLGNKVDITESEVLELLADDPETRVIMGYLEAVEDGRRFMEVAREVTRHKPVVLVKSGVTQAGAKAASSHTGALAGADSAYSAAFGQCGILRAHTVRELFNLAQALAHQPLPKGPAMVIVTNSGGPGIICADAVENSGMHLAGLQAATVEELRSFLPSIASFYNPVDLTGGAPAEMYARTLRAVCDDDNVQGALVIMTPAATIDPAQLTKLICEVETKKPVFATLMGSHSVAESRLYCMSRGMPAFDFPEDAVQAMRGMLTYQRWISSKPRQAKIIPGDQEKVAAIVSNLRSQGRLQMSETEARECFAAYGIPVARSVPAATSQEAAAAAREIGLPVVMKIDSPAIVHKSDVGGVAVGLQTVEAVADAFFEMTSRMHRRYPNAWVRGVLVQEMVKGGRETILGFNQDSQFGPLFMFGLGGIYVEVLKDVSFRVGPLSPEDADEMVKGIRSFPLLRGVRGEPPADLAALAEALLALSSLVHDFPMLAEADINPMLALPRGQGVVAVDARISLSPAKGDE